MADEIDAVPSAQGRRSDLVQVSDDVAPTYDEMGVTKQRVSEYRKMRDGYWTRARSSGVLQSQNETPDRHHLPDHSRSSWKYGREFCITTVSF